MNENETVYEVDPIESPSTEITTIVGEGDPEEEVLWLEKVAKLAPRKRQALNSILLAHTFERDWRSFGSGDDEKVCLSSAGAERVGSMFPIKIFDVTSKKEEFADKHGKGYRYVYEGWASLGARIIHAQGNYSTRDQLLGKVGEDYRPIEDIHEGNIRNAAYHIFMGNTYKALLGLRAMPRTEYDKIMSGSGFDPSKAGNVSHASGTKGGTTQDDSAKQADLRTACIDIASAGKFVERTSDGKNWQLCELTDALAELKNMELAKRVCEELSSFKGKDGMVAGKPAKELHGKRLDITTASACKLQGAL